MPCELLEAPLMHRVSTIKKARLLSTFPHVIETDGAVSLDHVVDVNVIFLDLDRNTGVAWVTVEELVPTTYSAQATLLAMELAL